MWLEHLSSKHKARGSSPASQNKTPGNTGILPGKMHKEVRSECYRWTHPQPYHKLACPLDIQTHEAIYFLCAGLRWSSYWLATKKFPIMIPLLPQLHKREVRGTAKIIIFFSETHIYSIMTDLNVWPHTKIIYSYSGPGEGQSMEFASPDFGEGTPRDAAPPAGLEAPAQALRLCNLRPKIKDWPLGNAMAIFNSPASDHTTPADAIPISLYYLSLIPQHSLGPLPYVLFPKSLKCSAVC